MEDSCDIAILGAGAAGLFAAIFAGREARRAGASLRIVAVDGARKPGAKILVAGGGRCNVTHDVVDESAYAGSSRHAVRKVLGRFGVEPTIAFFRELGVELKREATGKLFPVTDDAHTVLDALLRATTDAGAELRHPWRAAAVERDEDGFRIHRAAAASADATASAAPASPSAGPGAAGTLRARRLILATGGMALPRSGSDGAGYAFAAALGHTITPRVFPALVPLILDAASFVRTLSGLSVPATLTVRSGSGKELAAIEGSTLCTHFGLSGPGPLDISRHLTAARHADPAATLHVNWAGALPAAELDRRLTSARGAPAGRVVAAAARHIPERMLRALFDAAQIDPALPADNLPRDRRRDLVAAITDMPLPVTGDRGYTYAEVTAGGVPLAELHLDTMASRLCPGLHLCGELCDVDGRIGGYNFQWAWASGHVAGVAAARAAASPTA